MHLPVFHLGLEKSASSYLQKVVFTRLAHTSYRDELRREVYPLGKVYLSDAELEASPLYALRGQRALVSAEGGICKEYACSGREDVVDSVLVLSNLHKMFVGQCRLLFVLRRQDSAIDSMIRYKQRYLSDWRQYLLDWPVRKRPLAGSFVCEGLYPRLLNSYNYLKYVGLSVELFGRDRVHVVLYEDLKADPEAFFGGLGEALGEDTAGLMASAQTRVNAQSAKYDGLPGCYVPMGHLVRKLNNLSGHRLEKILPGRESGLPDERKAEVLALFRDGNRRLAALLGMDLARHGYC